MRTTTPVRAVTAFELKGEAQLTEFDQIRVLSKNQTIQMLNLSGRTWDRLEARGDTPPKTRISQGRIGYRVSDIREWLDRRRETTAA
jgi:predicted DNA-binding transcriptional regulator AlpA